MALDPLADLADVEDRLGRDLTAEESRRADALLRDASAVVRAYARRDFTAQRTTTRHRPRGDKVVLPERPVTAVHAVSGVQSFGTTEIVTPLVFWSWAGGFEVYIGDQALVINGPTWDMNDTNIWVEVDYSHGFETVPDDVIAVVSNLVVRGMTVPAGGLIDMESIGPYTTRYSGFTSAGPLALGDADRQVLNRYRSTAAHTVELRT